MASFSKMSIWSVGYLRAASRWLLRHRRTVSARVGAINAEIARIGFITVVYERVELPEGGVEVSENRVGFSVTPDSSLERLVRAYIARGGNPLNISSFMIPDRTQVLDDGSTISAYPQGGIAAPQSVDYDNPVNDPGSSGYENYRGGYVPLSGYAPGRVGYRANRGAWEDDAIVNVMHYTRRWANQDIKELQNMEWRIVKLMDLREQLVQERDEVLTQAFGGALTALDGEFDDDLFVRSHLVQNLVQDMYDLLYDPAPPEGPDDVFKAKGDLGFLEFVYEDVASEVRDPLG